VREAAHRCSVPRLSRSWGRAEGKGRRGGRPGRAMVDAKLVRDLTDHPQTMAVLTAPRGRPSGLLIPGPGRPVIADLAVQELAVGPQSQPSAACAVLNRVGGRLMRGDHDVVDPATSSDHLRVASCANGRHARHVRHATQEDLDHLEALLARLRKFPQLRKRRRGYFSRGSRAFLHFHEDSGDLYVDVKLDSAFQRMKVTSAKEQADFLSHVRTALTDQRFRHKRGGGTTCG
jgi:hypothetical protein